MQIKVLIASVLLFCGAGIVAPIEAQAVNSLGAYYELGSKYAEAVDTTAVATWQKQLIEKICQSGIQENLFTAKDGGGPNGAQWNPNNNLFIIATIDQPDNQKTLKIKSIEVRLNQRKQKIRTQQFSAHQGKTKVISFTLPQKLWEKHLRKASNSPLETFDLDLRIYLANRQTIKLSGKFIAAFGE